MEAKPAPSANLLALSDGTELVGDYRIRRVLGAGGFGITYLADETALGRLVTIKEYFPAEFAARRDRSAAPRSGDVADEYQWGLDRFIEEAQTLARFDHPNIVRVHRSFRANNTAYMVLHFEEGGSFKGWLKGLKRAPRQAELDRMIAPLLDALEIIHDANFLHRDIAPDNIMVRKDGSPVLIDFGSARGAVASHSRTVSALVKPGYSPHEQYATDAAKQGPWTDIYALGATLYHAIAGKRPPDAPSRVVSDDYVAAAEAALGSYRATFLEAVDKALRIEPGERPQSIADWRGALLEPEQARKADRRRAGSQSTRTAARQRTTAGAAPGSERRAVLAARDQDAELPSVSFPSSAESLVPAPPDAPQPKGQLLDFIEALKRHRPALGGRGRAAAKKASPEPAPQEPAPQEPAPQAPARVESLVGRLPPEPRSGFGFGRARSTRSSRRNAAAVDGRAAKPAPERAAADKPAPDKPAPEKARPKKAAPAKADAPQRAAAGGRRLLRIPMRYWRVGLFRVAVAVAVAGGAVAYQQSSQRPAIRAPAAIDAATPAPMQLTGHQGPVIAVATADDDRWIVSAGADATVRLWSASSGALVRTIALSEGAVTAFAVDGRRALVGHKTGTIVLWDLEMGERRATVQDGGGAVTSLAFLGDGFLAARGDGSVARYEVNPLPTGGAQATPAVLLDGQEGGGPLVAAANARSVFVSSGFDRAMRLWRAPGPRLARTFRFTGDITAIDIAPDARYVAGGSADGVVRVWPSPAFADVQTRIAQTFKAHEGSVTAVALGPPGMLATAGTDGSVKIWSLRPAHVLSTLAGAQVRTLSFSRDGRRLFAGGQDGLIQVWAMPPPAT